jgi:hypothetical protein
MKMQNIGTHWEPVGELCSVPPCPPRARAPVGKLGSSAPACLHTCAPAGEPEKAWQPRWREDVHGSGHGGREGADGGRGGEDVCGDGDGGHSELASVEIQRGVCTQIWVRPWTWYVRVFFLSSEFRVAGWMLSFG